MDDFMEQLQRNITEVEQIADRIEAGEEYREDIKTYLPELNAMVSAVFAISRGEAPLVPLDQGFATQVLQDVLYGLEQSDSVFLLDALRYGLLEIYYYVGEELQKLAEQKG